MTQKMSDYLIKWGDQPARDLGQAGRDFAAGFGEGLTGIVAVVNPPSDAPDYSHLAEPRDETETLATCPHCKCMGHHPVDVRTFRARVLPGARPGEWIDASTFGDPADGTKVVTRTCVFCERTWRR